MASVKPEWDVLLTCSKNNQSQDIRGLVEEEGVDPNHANRVGQSALHIAALWGHVEAVQVLLELGANPNAQNTITGATPLHCAIQSSKASNLNRQMETVQALLQAGADSSRGDLFGCTPADYCEEENALTNLLRQIHAPPVFIAIQNEKVVELQRILQEDASVVQSRHEYMTPLLFTVKMIVEQEDKDTDSCLEMIRLLLESGANPNHTPNANRNGHLTVQEDAGDAALHRICEGLKNATEKTHVEGLQNAALLLKRYNAIVPPATQLLVHDAARRNQLDFMKFMIDEMEVSPNVQGRQGMTPLHFAARSGKKDIVEWLLSKEGIDAKIQDELGKTALDAARVNNKSDILAMLEELTAKTPE